LTLMVMVSKSVDGVADAHGEGERAGTIGLTGCPGEDSGRSNRGRSGRASVERVSQRLRGQVGVGGRSRESHERAFWRNFVPNGVEDRRRVYFADIDVDGFEVAGQGGTAVCDPDGDGISARSLGLGGGPSEDSIGRDAGAGGSPSVETIGESLWRIIVSVAVAVNDRLAPSLMDWVPMAARMGGLLAVPPKFGAPGVGGPPVQLLGSFPVERRVVAFKGVAKAIRARRPREVIVVNDAVDHHVWHRAKIGSRATFAEDQV
jgi:hypothetical protein